MNVWLALSLILAVAAIYMFMIEVFSVAFKLTGLATKKIRFQVASLFTGSGFTTAESELITNDDRRRSIAVTCMYTGHIFSVVIMGLIINVFISIGASIGADNSGRTFTEWYFIVFYISSGIFLLVLLIKIRPINIKFQALLEKIAINASKRGRNTNIITVLDFYGKSAIVEVMLNRIPDVLKEISLLEMELAKKYRINVLSIKRGKRIIEVTKDTMFNKGDMLVIYGPITDIQTVFIESLDKTKKAIVVDKTNIINLLNNYGSNALVEIEVDEVPAELENVSMKESHLVDRYSINIVVIKRKDEYLFADRDTIIEKGDKITLFGPYKNIKHLFKNDEK